jgi:hypothetical protein
MDFRMNIKTTSMALFAISVTQFMAGAVYSQDRGSRPFENLENSIIRQRIAEESLAIEALEKELVFRKTRLTMLESGAKKRQLYDSKIDRPEISNANFVAKPKEIWDVLPRWKTYLGDSSESCIKDLEDAFSELREVQSWYLFAKKERVELEYHLLCKNRDQALLVLDKAPSTKNWKSQVKQQFETHIKEVESSRQNLEKRLDSLGNAALDFTTISESDLNRKE